MNKEIEKKLDEIINYIKETSSYQNYIKAKAILETREDLKITINEIKKLQKILVNNPNDIKTEQELNDKIKLLELDPCYVQYNNYLIEVNNYLNIFESKINKYFEDVFR